MFALEAKAWTVKLVDSDVRFASHIQECFDSEGKLALFALNVDHTIWKGAPNGRLPEWKFYQMAPKDSYDMVCAKGALHIVRPAGLRPVEPEMSSEDVPHHPELQNILNLFTLPLLDQTGTFSYGLSALFKDHSIQLAMDEEGYEWTESSAPFPYLVKVESSLAHWQNGAPLKPAAFIGMDQDRTRFWYSDAGGQPGTWEISSLSIPYDANDNSQTDFSVGVGGVTSSETRRMTGLYVLRNGSLYWAVP